MWSIFITCLISKITTTRVNVYLETSLLFRSIQPELLLIPYPCSLSKLDFTLSLRVPCIIISTWIFLCRIWSSFLPSSPSKKFNILFKAQLRIHLVSRAFFPRLHNPGRITGFHCSHSAWLLYIPLVMKECYLIMLSD